MRNIKYFKIKEDLFAENLEDSNKVKSAFIELEYESSVFRYVQQNYFHCFLYKIGNNSDVHYFKTIDDYFINHHKCEIGELICIQFN